jgi:hypothetical protein
MKVYVVREHGVAMSDDGIHGVFSTREKALEYLEGSDHELADEDEEEEECTWLVIYELDLDNPEHGCHDASQRDRTIPWDDVKSEFGL